MKITKVEVIYQKEGSTVQGEQIAWIWVRVHTDEVITGLGETYPLGEAERGVIRARLADHVSQPLCISERLMTRYQFRELMELGIAQFIMPDICWCGGITEVRKVAVLADTYHLPIAPHNCGGPVLHLASIHLATHLTNLFILESVRRHYLVHYVNFVTDPVPVKDGYLTPPNAPGLGIDIKPEILTDAGIQIETIEA